MKKGLKGLNISNGNLKAKVEVARKKLHDLRRYMSCPPSQSDCVMESLLISNYFEALKDEEIFLRQKSRAIWIKNGDGNNKYFFNYCKGRWNSNKILEVKDSAGVLHQGQATVASIKHFEDLLYHEAEVSNIPEYIDIPSISQDSANDLIKNVTLEEILSTFKSVQKHG